MKQSEVDVPTGPLNMRSLSHQVPLQEVCNVPRRAAFEQGPPLADAGVHAYIIEDNYLIAKALQDMLEDLGFTKFSFARSEDAAVLGANQPDIDLITADVRLLPGDGVNAVEEICAERQIPVLFVTAYRDELLERKPDAVVLQKPVQEEELRAAVRQLIHT